MNEISQQSMSEQHIGEQGTSFSVATREFDSANSPGLSSAQAGLSNMSVLLVEDNRANQLIAQEFLESEGAMVMLAENGKEALDLLKNVESSFDIVLMDIQMPVMDGYQATREIRKTLGFSQLPIVAMSANALQSDCKAAFAAGMNGYIEKPFDLEFMVKKLIQLCHWDKLNSDKPTALINYQNNTGQNKVDENYLFSVDTALTRFNGKADIYHRALRVFIQDSQQLVATLPESLAGSNHANILSSLHSIKGMAANFGADAVAKLCKKMEMELAFERDVIIDQAGYRRDLAQLQSTLSATCQRIQQKLTVRASLSKNKLSGLQARDLSASLLQLAALLAQSDLEALSLHQCLFDKFSAVKPVLFQSLDNSVKQLEFAGAEKICYAICASLENGQ